MDLIIQLIQANRIDLLAALVLQYLGWVPVFGVMVWGMVQVWQDVKQGQYVSGLKWHMYEVKVPPESINTPKGMENFFQNLAGSKSTITWKEAWLVGKIQPWFAFELVSIGGVVHFFFRTTTKYDDLFEAALYAQYPDAQIIEVEDYTKNIPDHYPNGKMLAWGSEMILQKDQYFPIRTYTMFEHMGEKDFRFKDPILPVIELLGKFKPHEMFCIQLIVQQPNEQDWSKEGIKYIHKQFGKEEKKKPKGIAAGVGWFPNEVLKQTVGLSLSGEVEEKKQDDWAAFKITTDEKLRMDAIHEKVSKIGWRSKIRILFIGAEEGFVARKGTVAAITKGIFHQYAHLNWNKFGLHDQSTPKDDYIWQVWQMHGKMNRLVARYKRRKLPAGSTPYILNSEELATLFHFPGAGARTPVLTAPGAKRAEPPINLQWTSEEHTLPNLDRKATDMSAMSEPMAAVPPMVPHPVSPTSSVPPTPATPSLSATPMAATERMPQPGMPAPLPPGIDSAETQYDPTPDAPDNLPM